MFFNDSPEKVCCCCCSIFGRRSIKKQQRWLEIHGQFWDHYWLESWIFVEQYLIMIVEFSGVHSVHKCLVEQQRPFRRCNFLDKRKKSLFAHFLKFCKLKKSCGTTLLKTLLQIQGRILNTTWRVNIEEKRCQKLQDFGHKCNLLSTKWPQITQNSSQFISSNENLIFSNKNFQI